MKEELEQRLLTALDGIIEVVRTSADAAGRELPILVQEYLHWQLFNNIFTICWIIFVFTSFAFVGWRCWKKARWTCDGPENLLAGCAMGCAIVCVVVGMVGVFVIPYATREIIKIKTAPRVVIVEKAVELAGLKK